MFSTSSSPRHLSHAAHSDLMLPAEPQASVDLPSARKRRRIINSCMRCRHRKARCDRQHPCGECVKNDDLCQYQDAAVLVSAQNLSPQRSGTSGDSPRRNQQAGSPARDDIGTRVAKVEAILEGHLPLFNHLQSLHASQNSSQVNTSGRASHHDNAHSQSINGLAEVQGHLRGKHGRKTEFVSSRHWTGLIHLFPELPLLRHRPPNDPLFAELNRVFGRLRNRMLKPSLATLPSLVPTLSIESALHALVPPKSVADVLLNVYLRTFENLHRVLHIPTFSKEYESFWKSPDSVGSSWLATLIVVLRLGLLVYPIPDELLQEATPAWNEQMEAQSLQLVELFLHFRSAKGRPSLAFLQVQCLVVFARITDGSKSPVAWKLAGGVMQTCLIMGLHKDPAAFPDVVSIFDAEMRRRLWTTTMELCVHVSRATSFELFISDNGYKIQRPANTNDEDISAQVAEPPSTQPLAAIMDTLFQHVLSGSLPLRLQLSRTTQELVMAMPSGAHCVDCELQNQLSQPDSSFTMTGSELPGRLSPTLQRIFLSLIAEATFLHFKLISLPSVSNHSKELVLESCRTVLRLHQDPELSLEQRFIVERWFRNDIIRAILCLCLSLRTSCGNGLRGDVILAVGDLDQHLEHKTVELIEQSLCLFGQRQDPNRNEVEEHVLLALLVAIVKSKGSDQAVLANFQECITRFGPYVLILNETVLGGEGSHQLNSDAPGSTRMFANGIAEGTMNMGFDIDAFMFEFGFSVPF